MKMHLFFILVIFVIVPKIVQFEIVLAAVLEEEQVTMHVREITLFGKLPVWCSIS